ncbi:tetratricopeptide repeat protein 28-like protein [Pitangus sulphuratus]|nr:tetratricopeptide repeat protein 28-like protein [Pitangus sulphuratus]
MEQQAPPPPPGAVAGGRARRERDAEPARLSFFGSKSLGRKSPDSPMLSKAEFVEKVRQSNQACHDGDFHTAIVLYNEALGVDPQNCILYSNRSAAYMKIQQYDKALDDAIKARLLNPKWPKVKLEVDLAQLHTLSANFQRTTNKTPVLVTQVNCYSGIFGTVPFFPFSSPRHEVWLSFGTPKDGIDNDALFDPLFPKGYKIGGVLSQDLVH